MERISALIEKLRGQFAAGADIEQLLLTTQLLEGELRYHRQKGTVPASPHVAVLMPNNGNRLVQRQEPAQRQEPVQHQEPAQRPEPVQHQEPIQRPEPAPRQEPTYRQTPPQEERTPEARPEPVLQQPALQQGKAPEAQSAREIKSTPEVNAPLRTNDPNPEHERYLPHKETSAPGKEKPAEKEMQAEREKPLEREKAADREKAAEKAREQEPIAFNPIKDVPTLTHQIPQEARNKEVRKDLNEAIARENGRSLNDTLKGQQRELSAVLTEAPIRDLRKAIGINDRYVFISELFRGDEIMYERSVKTINNFSIYQEAYYWMERELKLKLAWDIERKSTELFYQLVRRRFS